MTRRLNLSPEDRLLVVCVRLDLTPDQREELNSLLRLSVDWDQLLYKSQWHNVTPLVFRHLCQLEEWDRVPAEAKEQLKATYLAIVARNLYLQAELRRALAALEARGVPVILLKGAALADTVYGDFGLRQMSDLDLLIPEGQAHLAQATIQGLGYQPVGTSDEQDDTDKHHRHLPGLAGVEKPVLFEVHRHIVRQDSALHFDIEGFWARAQEVSVAGTRARVLAPEDLLIHLALNFFLDRQFQSLAALRQLCDIAESTRYYQDRIQWQLFTDNVQGYELTGPVGCTMYLAQELLGAKVPREVGEQLWPDGFEATEVERFLRRRVLDPRPWVARALVTPGSEYGRGRVMLAALRRLIPSRRYMAQRHHISSLGVRGTLLYLARLGEGLRILLRSVLHPGELNEDMAIDRWHHSLYRYRANSASRGNH